VKHTILKTKLVIFGFGSIGPAVLPLILKHIQIDPSQIEIISANNLNEELADSFNIKFDQFEVTRENYKNYFSNKLMPGDILLNLTVGVSSLDLIKLCHELNVLYLDTSNEVWKSASHTQSTTHGRRASTLEQKYLFKNGPTALICHGANPGLISHFVKQAILDVVNRNATAPLEAHTSWADMAKKSGIVALHISEQDTQRTNLTIRKDEYANTWSIDGFFEEAFSLAEFSWGTHETNIPAELVNNYSEYNKSRIIELKKHGCEMQIESWIPSSGIFQGLLIPHPEAYSIAELLTTDSYQPTVHFVYRPCSAAIESLKIAKQTSHFNYQKKLLLHDITNGMDELGILVLRQDTPEVYWFGSRLDIHTANSLAPNNNATSLQVAAGVLAGLVWIIENPTQGLIEPEQVDFKRALEIAKPYLGIYGGQWGNWDNSKSISVIDSNNFSWKFNYLHT
jgi:homospermidine synthase